jgi:hypothetical protein
MKNKRTQELGNKNLLSFPKHNSLKNNANSHMSIQCVGVIILIIFWFVRRQMVSPKKVHVQTTWNFTLQKIASNACHRSGHVWQLSWYPFLTLGKKLRLGKKKDFLMVGSAKCLQRKTYLFDKIKLMTFTNSKYNTWRFTRFEKF